MKNVENVFGKMLAERYATKSCYIFREEHDDEGNFVFVAQIPDGTEVEGHGKSKRLAKRDACRKAIKLL